MVDGGVKLCVVWVVNVNENRNRNGNKNIINKYLALLQFLFLEVNPPNSRDEIEMVLSQYFQFLNIYVSTYGF